MNRVFELTLASSQRWPRRLDFGTAKLVFISARVFVTGRVRLGMRVRVASRRLPLTNTYLALAIQRLDDGTVLSIAMPESVAGIGIAILALGIFTWYDPSPHGIDLWCSAALLVYFATVFGLTVSACRVLKTPKHPGDVTVV